MIKCKLEIVLAQRKVNRAPPYTYIDLSAATGLHRDTISKLAGNKTTRYDAHVLDALCRVLGVGITDLLEYVPDGPAGE